MMMRPFPEDDIPIRRSGAPDRAFSTVFSPVDAIVVVLLMSAAFFVYSNTFAVPFVFDDIPNIVENPHIRMDDISLDKLLDAAFNSPQRHRPVANVTLAVNYYLHQYRVAGYHLFNIWIHGLTGILLYFLFQYMQIFCPIREKIFDANRVDTSAETGERHPARPAMWVSFFAALLWIVHPLNTQAVTYIVQRMAVLAALFSVLCLLLYSMARDLNCSRAVRGGLYAGAVMAGMLAMGSKENAFVLPAVLLVYEWILIGPARRHGHRRHIIALTVGTGIAVISGMWLMDFRPVAYVLNTYDGRDFTVYQRLLTQFRVLGQYLVRVFYPHPSLLNIDHDVPLSVSWIHPVSTLVWAIVFGGVAVSAVISVRRRPFWAFTVFWVMLTLVVESSVIGLEMMFEHRMYLPMMMIIMVIVSTLKRLVSARWLSVSILCITMVVFGGWTLARNQVWQSPYTLWRDAAMKSPDKARPQNKLGYLLEQRGRLKEARKQYEKAVTLKPDFVYAYYNLGNVLHKMGQRNEAIAQYRKAISINPNFGPAYVNLGLMFAETGDTRQAARCFRQAIKNDPREVRAYVNLGNLLAGETAYTEAVSLYSRALSIDPGFAEAHNNLAQVLLTMGDAKTAAVHFREALRYAPEAPQYHYNYANLLRDTGWLKPAILQYRRALALDPDFPAAHNNLGIAYHMIGDNARAAAHFKAALALEPANRNYRQNLEKIEKTGISPNPDGIDNGIIHQQGS